MLKKTVLLCTLMITVILLGGANISAHKTVFQVELEINSVILSCDVSDLGVVVITPSAAQQRVMFAAGDDLVIDLTSCGYLEGVYLKLNPELFYEFIKSIRITLEGGYSLTLNGQNLLAIHEQYNKRAVWIKFEILDCGVSLRTVYDGGDEQSYSAIYPALISIPRSVEVSEDTIGFVLRHETGIVGRSLYKNGFVVGCATNPGVYTVEYSPVLVHSDISGRWMEDAVNFMVARNVIDSDGAGIFLTNVRITGAEFLTVLERLFGADDLSYFSPEGNLDTPITREEMFDVVNRLISAQNLYIPIVNPPNFVDVDTSPACESLSKIGLVRGMSATLAEPETKATRAQAMQLLYNYVLFLGEHCF